MSDPRERLRQARDLVRLRQVRMEAAGRALADARMATAAAEAARAAADADADHAAAAYQSAREDLAADPAEAARRLAMLDRRRFQRSMALETLSDARDAEHARVADEAARRHAMIVARARHDVLAERLGLIARHASRLEDEREALDAEDVRRFR